MICPIYTVLWFFYMTDSTSILASIIRSRFKQSLQQELCESLSIVVDDVVGDWQVV